MDYMEFIKKSLSNAWNYKFLWLFGFFVSVADGFGGGHWWTDKFDKTDWGAGLDYIGIEPAVLIFFALAVFSLWVIFWVMSVIAEGSLIHCISRKELNLAVNFSDCWSVGLGKFFRLFGIMLLAGLAALFVIICLALFVVPAYFASVGLGVILTILAIPVLFVIIIVTVSVEGWAIRFATLNDMRWLDAIGKGWHLFKDNIGKTLGVAFSSFLTQLVLWCVLAICMLVMSIPFILAGTLNLWFGLIPGIGLGLLIILLSSAFFGTFASPVWTLGFMQMTEYTGIQAVTAADTNPPTT